MLTKAVFLHNVSHTQLNYAFLLFWRIFGEMRREHFFLVKNVNISERSTEILRKLVFLNMFEKGKSWGKFGFVLTTVFGQTSKRGQILTKTFFLQNMSLIHLNYAFLLFRSNIRLIHWKILFLVQKVTISEKSTEIFRKFVFLNEFEKVQILRKISIFLNNFFWSNQ